MPRGAMIIVAIPQAAFPAGASHLVLSEVSHADRSPHADTLGLGISGPV